MYLGTTYSIYQLCIFGLKAILTKVSEIMCCMNGNKLNWNKKKMKVKYVRNGLGIIYRLAWMLFSLYRTAISSKGN